MVVSDVAAVGTNTLSGCSAYSSDADWAHHPLASTAALKVEPAVVGADLSASRPCWPSGSRFIPSPPAPNTASRFLTSKPSNG